MPRKGQRLTNDVEAPYKMRRPCDHCAKHLPEAELVPQPKTNSYLVHAPELLCGACWQRTQRRSIRKREYGDISERCLMDHDLQKFVSNDIANCTACGASCLPGTDMLECITCADLWIYCVDCKLASGLRPSYKQRQHNAQARARGKVLYQCTLSRQPSIRSMSTVGEEQQEEEKGNETEGKKEQGK